MSITDPATAFLTMPGSAVKISSDNNFSARKLRKEMGKGRHGEGGEGEGSDGKKVAGVKVVVRDNALPKLLRSLATCHEPVGPAIHRRNMLRDKQAKYRVGTVGAQQPGALSTMSGNGARYVCVQDVRTHLACVVYVGGATGVFSRGCFE